MSQLFDIVTTSYHVDIPGDLLSRYKILDYQLSNLIALWQHLVMSLSSCEGLPDEEETPVV